MTQSKQYPECEKLGAVRDKSQLIGEFLDWLSDYEIVLARYNPNSRLDQLMEHSESTESLLAKFFDIDMGEVERERQQMIDDLRK